MNKDSVYIDSIAADTAVIRPNFALTKAVAINDTESSLYYHCIIGGGSLIVVVSLAYICYKQIRVLKRHLYNLKKKFSEQNDSIVGLNEIIQTMRTRLDIIEQNASASSIQIPEPSRRDVKQGATVSAFSKNVSQETVIPTSRIVKYATLQAPDANGVLRFAERSMSDEATEQKMFEVELDTITGTGVYRINHKAISVLLDDLQQLCDFVEPFTMDGNASARNIVNDKPGRIHQEGKFWIVDERAKIRIV